MNGWGTQFDIAKYSFIRILAISFFLVDSYLQNPQMHRILIEFKTTLAPKVKCFQNYLIT